MCFTTCAYLTSKIRLKILSFVKLFSGAFVALLQGRFENPAGGDVEFFLLFGLGTGGEKRNVDKVASSSWTINFLVLLSFLINCSSLIIDTILVFKVWSRLDQ